MKYSLRRQGITLVELLIVIGMVIVLMGLLLPAVQKVRTAAVRLVCANNLRELATAAHNYHGVNGKLPPGSLGAPPETSRDSLEFWDYQHVGLLAHLLPFLEQENIFRELKVDWNLEAKGNPWWSVEENWRAAHHRIPSFLCPADDAQQAADAWVLVRLFERGMAIYYFGHGEGRNLGRTNYVGVAGALGRTGDPHWDRWQGVFSTQSHVKLENVRDGTSYTLMFGELLGRSPEIGFDHTMSWMGVGYFPTAWGLHSPSEWHQWDSRHAAVVQFAWCDGSVRGVAKSARPNPFRYASGYKDGFELDLSDVSY